MGREKFFFRLFDLSVFLRLLLQSLANGRNLRTKKRVNPSRSTPAFHVRFTLVFIHAAAHRITRVNHMQSQAPIIARMKTMVYPLNLFRAVPCATIAMLFPVLVLPVQSLHCEHVKPRSFSFEAGHRISLCSKAPVPFVL